MPDVEQPAATGARPCKKRILLDNPDQAIPLMRLAVLIANVEIIEANAIALSFVRSSAEYDRVVEGALKEGVFASVPFGETREKAARPSKNPMMIQRPRL